MKLEGGNNPKSTANVDERGRVSVIAQVEPNDRLANRLGQVWSIAFAVTPTANNYFFYLQNLSAQNLNITDFRSSSETALATVLIRSVSGTPVPTGPVTPEITARNLNSTKEIDADINVAASITGLTSLGELFFEEYPVAGKRERLQMSSNIIIPQGKAIALFSDTAAALGFIVSAVQEAQ